MVIARLSNSIQSSRYGIDIENITTNLVKSFIQLSSI